jgi:hypothetical protein
MAQVFHPALNPVAKASVFGALLMVAAAFGTGAFLYNAPYSTGVHVAREQPVQFSHAHHVGGLGIDCRYCHPGVEEGPFAGMPSTRTCMNCHAQVWAESPFLAPVRESFATGRPIAWNRVHDLPDFAYFDHSIHVRQGIGCSTCHGRVDEMPLIWKTESLFMKWCLDCHERPERYVRPREAVFDMDWEPPEDQEARGRALVREYGIRKPRDCSVCHR